MIEQKNLFCFFSGFTKISNYVTKIENDDDQGVKKITLCVSNKEIFSINEYLQLNGVLCQLIKYYNPVTIIVSTTYELIVNTSLQKIRIGDKVNLGRLAEKETQYKELYTLQPTTFGKAILYKIGVLSGHVHTRKLDFYCDVSYKDFIRENEYIGISGSSLTPREVMRENNKLYFSIYCGQQTQENSHFNQNLEIGTEVDLLMPNKIILKPF